MPILRGQREKPSALRPDLDPILLLIWLGNPTASVQECQKTYETLKWIMVSPLPWLPPSFQTIAQSARNARLVPWEKRNPSPADAMCWRWISPGPGLTRFTPPQSTNVNARARPPETPVLPPKSGV